jgi:hypothetical protein
LATSSEYLTRKLDLVAFKNCTLSVESIAGTENRKLFCGSILPMGRRYCLD